MGGFESGGASVEYKGRQIVLPDQIAEKPTPNKILDQFGMACINRSTSDIPNISNLRLPSQSNIDWLVPRVAALKGRKTWSRASVPLMETELPRMLPPRAGGLIG